MLCNLGNWKRSISMSALDTSKAADVTVLPDVIRTKCGRGLDLEQIDLQMFFCVSKFF